MARFDILKAKVLLEEIYMKDTVITILSCIIALVQLIVDGLMILITLKGDKTSSMTQNFVGNNQQIMVNNIHLSQNNVYVQDNSSTQNVQQPPLSNSINEKDCTGLVLISLLLAYVYHKYTILLFIFSILTVLLFVTRMVLQHKFKSYKKYILAIVANYIISSIINICMLTVNADNEMFTLLGKPFCFIAFAIWNVFLTGIFVQDILRWFYTKFKWSVITMFLKREENHIRALSYLSFIVLVFSFSVILISLSVNRLLNFT